MGTAVLTQAAGMQAGRLRLPAWRTRGASRDSRFPLDVEVRYRGARILEDSNTFNSGNLVVTLRQGVVPSLGMAARGTSMFQL